MAHPESQYMGVTPPRTENSSTGSFRGEDETAIYSHTAMCHAQVSEESHCYESERHFLFAALWGQNYGLFLDCFSLSCNPGAISLSRIAFHMESENC